MLRVKIKLVRVEIKGNDDHGESGEQKENKYMFLAFKKYFDAHK